MALSWRRERWIGLLKAVENVPREGLFVFST